MMKRVHKKRPPMKRYQVELQCAVTRLVDGSESFEPERETEHPVIIRVDAEDAQQARRRVAGAIELLVNDKVDRGYFG